MKTKILSRYIKLINLYPPFVGAGIRLKEVNKDRTRFVITLRLTARNKNLFGTQFGGSLFAMTDPFHAFILVMNLGKEYIVWDKSASISFLKPGKSKVTAIIEIDPNEIQRIKSEILEVKKSTYTFTTEIKNKEGEVVARAQKEVYIRLK